MTGLANDSIYDVFKSFSDFFTRIKGQDLTLSRSNCHNEGEASRSAISATCPKCKRELLSSHFPSSHSSDLPFVGAYLGPSLPYPAAFPLSSTVPPFSLSFAPPRHVVALIQTDRQPLHSRLRVSPSFCLSPVLLPSLRRLSLLHESSCRTNFL